MTAADLELLRLLADGRPASGERLAEALSISRSAVWKRIESLRAAGLVIEGQAGDGYRLDPPADLLDPARLESELAAAGISAEVHPVLDSTSVHLARSEAPHRRAVLAEYQSGGRGRRGRSWLSPPAGGVYLSLGHAFDCGLPRLSALSLVAGLAAARAVEAATNIAPGLKWPNDLVVDGAKLGGLLVEVSGAADGPCLAVIGVGVNVRLGAGAEPDQAWTDLYREGWTKPDRTALAIALATTLDRDCARFQAEGFEAFSDEWRARDVLDGIEVVVHQAGGGSTRGIARGVSPAGGLRLEAGGNGQSRFLELSAGEVSVRAR